MRRVIDFYHAAGRTEFEHSRVSRGVKNSVSGKTEDLLACYLITKIPNDCEILINTNLHVENTNMRPDLIIHRNGSVIAFVEVKMDLGWVRGSFGKYCEEYDNKIKSLNGKKGAYRQVVEPNRNVRKSIVLSNKLKCFVVVVSDKNIKIDTFKENFKRARSLAKNKRIDVFCLSSNVHPNNPSYAEKSKLLNHMDIRLDDFYKLELEINKLI